MSTNIGKTYVKFYHPTECDITCNIEIKWAHHSSPGSLEAPGDDDIDIKNIKMISYCDEYVNSDEIPEWVTFTDLYNSIDVTNYQTKDED